MIDYPPPVINFLGTTVFVRGSAQGNPTENKECEGSNPIQWGAAASGLKVSIDAVRAAGGFILILALLIVGWLLVASVSNIN